MDRIEKLNSGDIVKIEEYYEGDKTSVKDSVLNRFRIDSGTGQETERENRTSYKRYEKALRIALKDKNITDYEDEYVRD